MGKTVDVPFNQHVVQYPYLPMFTFLIPGDFVYGYLNAAPKYPPPPLQTPGLARDGLPGGGGDGRQVTVSRGGGGDCKGILGQTVVPTTDASKENTCEATCALMPKCYLQHKWY